MAKTSRELSEEPKPNIELINFRFDEFEKAQERTESKVDTLTAMVGKLSYVDKKEYAEDQKKLVNKEQLESLVLVIIKDWFKPYKLFLLSVGSALAIALGTAVLNFILKGGLLT